MVRDPLVLALALRLVGLAGALVPRASREDWKREWRAELWHLHRSREERSSREDAAFLLRSLGSTLDALQLRTGDAQAWSESVSAVIARWGRHSPAVAIGLLFLSLGIAADTLLLAFARLTLGLPLSPWSTLVAEGRTVILTAAITCGIALIVASAAAAAQLLGFAESDPRGDAPARVVEMILIAAVTAWLARGLALFGMRSVAPPHAAPWLAAVELGSAVDRAWLVTWLLGLALLAVARSLRRERPARVGR